VTARRSPNEATHRTVRIRRFYTDDWGAYKRHLDPLKHEVGKQNTQKIANKHLNLQRRIKRLARRTICFS
jgi:insertion element IS1 protein InsB